MTQNGYCADLGAHFQSANGFLETNPNPAQNAAPPLVNNPLAPPHATTNISFLVPRVSRASGLGAKRQSESATALGEGGTKGGTCGQTRHATNHNPFETEVDLHHPWRNAGA